MAATGTDMPDDFKRWWETFNNGRTVGQGQHEEEDGADSDSGFELAQQQPVRHNAHAPAGREGGSGAARDCDVAEEGISQDGHFQREGELQARNREAADKLNTPRASEDEDEHVSEDNQVQIGGGLQGMKREVTAKRNKPRATEIEIQNEEGQDKYVSEDNHVQIGGGLQGMKREVTAKRNEPRVTEIEIKNEEGQDKYVSADNYVQIGGWEQGRKRKATVGVAPNGVQPIGIEIQNKTSHGECLRAENQMSRLQIVSKTKELEAELIRRLELELHLKTEENKSLKKQNEELRAENEHYRKTKKGKAVRVL